jgi:hypothetical protein
MSCRHDGGPEIRRLCEETTASDEPDRVRFIHLSWFPVPDLDIELLSDVDF